MAQHDPPTHSAADNLPQADGAAGGDLASLIVAHHAALYRYAYRLCGCPTEAEDLTQQTFLIAQQRLHQVRDAERTSGWLYTVLRSTFLKSVRRQRPLNAASANVELEEAAGVQPEVANVELEEAAGVQPEVDEIDREALARAIGELPVEFRLVVLMYYFEDLSYQQIAEQLEIPAGTVMSRLSRAKQHLRKRLEARDAVMSPDSTDTSPHEPGTVSRNSPLHGTR
ncbi:MAG: RNA polymerase sigma factor, partial [Pirellulaceae bacterium]|nr:RNA polymerase sigma factor [Pirellulaceae bacterium]